ncbi:MAG: hypothetical protein V3W45_04460 [Sedimentisphaerales bacterium]
MEDRRQMTDPSSLRLPPSHKAMADKTPRQAGHFNCRFSIYYLLLKNEILRFAQNDKETLRLLRRPPSAASSQ